MTAMNKFLLVFILFPILCNAQVEKVLIKGEFINTPLPDFIRQTEQKHQVRFYYMDAVVKEVVLNGLIKYPTPLLKALDILLANHKISFSTNAEGHIILFANENKTIKKQQEFYQLKGSIRNKNTFELLPFVSVYIPALAVHTISDTTGNFVFPNLTKDTYLLRISYLGYKPLIQKISLHQDMLVSIELEEKAMELKEIVVTPSIFEISTVEGSPLRLGKEEILHSPNMGKDIYRTLRALPGIANSDYSSKARIRGGHSDETTVYLDHFQINDPFHLDEVDGSFSIFNTDYIDELTVLTGGFSAKYADRLSGVIDVKTFNNIDGNKYQASVDLVNTSFLAQKKIGDKVNIFLTARRGYLDFLLDNVMDDSKTIIEPRFSDFWGKISLNTNTHHSFSLNALIGKDKFYILDRNNLSAFIDVKNRRNNINSWINWKWIPSKAVSSVTTFGYQENSKNSTFVFPENLSINNRDFNNTGSFVLTNNTFADITETKSMEAGFELRYFNSKYVYHEKRLDVFNSPPENQKIDDINIDTNFSGYIGAVYAQYNWTIKKNLILQPGIRVSSQNYTSSVQFAPRIALRYDLSESFSTRLAYGIYYQPDLYYKLRTSLAQESPYKSVNKCIHYTGSLTYSKARTNVLLNVYYKDYKNLFDDFRFEYFNRLVGANIPDVSFGTNSGVSKGFEILLRQNYGKNSMISISYARSSSRIQNTYGFKTARDFDQPHTIIMNNIFRLPLRWNLSFLWTYHTGFPYTPTNVDYVTPRPGSSGVILHYETGLKNTARLPDFHTLDLRIEKSWYFGRNQLMFYLNVVNFYNRENVRSYWWFPYKSDANTISFDRETQVNIPFFVSPGLSFTLY
jgi:hypothetical protein